MRGFPNPVWFSGFAFLFLAACAQIGAPQGGPKDNDPPSLVEASPPLGTVQILPERVELQFDEFVTLQNVFKEVLISPPMSGPPNLMVKGKSVIMTFPDTLLPDKTYTVNFGNAIRDQTEGNVLSNFTYLFATGKVLDSLKIHGSVRDALTAEPDKDMLVLLYPAGDREIIQKERPYYFARTDPSGAFSLNHLQAGSYQLVALSDQNFNYLFDLPNEKIGFADSLITVDSTDRVYRLETFLEQSGAGQLTRVKALRYGLAEAVFSSSVDTSTVRIEKPTGVRYRYNAGFDTLHLWVNDLQRDSLMLTQQLDTLTIQKAVALRTIAPDSLRLKQKLGIASTIPIPLAGKGGADKTVAEAPVVPFELGRDLILTMGNPVSVLRTDHFLLRNLSNRDTLRVPWLWLDSLHTKIRLDYDFPPEQLFEIQLGSGFATDLYGSTNDSIRLRFQTRAKKDYGELVMNLQWKKDTAFVLELLDAANRVVRRQVSGATTPNSPSQRLVFSYLKPGPYQLRFIVDYNSNSKWDPGDYQTGRQSEPVYRFSETINLRSDWVLEFDWEPLKSQTPE